MLKKYAKILYIILIFYILWLVVIPLTLSALLNNVLPELANDHGVKLELKNARVRTSVLPNISLKSDEIVLLNKDGSTPLDITDLKLNLRILPLVTGRVFINSFSINSINARFVAEDKLYLGDYELPKLDFKLEPKKLRLRNARMNTYDVVLAEHGRLHKFNGQGLQYINTKKKIVFKLKSDFSSGAKSEFDIYIPMTKNESKYKFNAKIKLLDLKEFSPLITSYVRDIKSVNGLINLSSKKDKLDIVLKDFSVIYHDNSRSIIFPRVLKANSRFRIYDNTLDINQSDIKTDSVWVSAAGTVKNIFSTTPQFDTHINLNRINMREGALMLPNIVTEDISTIALKKHAFYGTMTGGIWLKGAFPTPDVLGEINVRDGMMIKPIKNSKGKARIDIKFIGQKLLLDVDVPVNYNEWVRVDGDIKLYGEKFANLDIKSSNSVDLDTAEFVLNPLHEIFRFEIGPAPIMDISGHGGANLKIVGTKKDPHIWGKFVFYNTNARFLEVNNLLLKNADGILEFKDRMAHFINNSGTVNGKPATIDGYCSLFGDLDFNVTAKNQRLSDLVTILTTSPMLVSMKDMVPPIKDIKGNADFLLNLKGEKVLHIEDLKINENVIAQGSIKLLGNDFNFEGLDIKAMKGLVNFHKTDCLLDLKGKLSTNSNISVQGKIQDNIADIKVVTPKIIINELNIKELKFLDNLGVKFNAKYKGRINKIAVGGIDAQINVLKSNLPVKNCKIETGQITLKNSNLRIRNMTGYVRQNPFFIDMNIKNLGKESLDISKSNINGSFKCKGFDLTALNYFKSLDLSQSDFKKELDKITVVKGVTDIDFQAKNNKFNSVLNLSNVDLTYAVREGEKQEQVEIPVKLIDGKIVLKDNKITLRKLNCLIDEMPILIFGKIENIYKNPKYNIYINSKLVQKVFTKYWNAYNIYPIKVSGDIVSTVILTGDKTRTNINLETMLEDNSEIYYMGAAIGDLVNPITLKLDMDLYKKEVFKINSFSYNKVISSQNNKQNELPLLNISGEIKKRGKVYYYKDLVIRSENPVDANLFNILFKKPTIKQGTFVSDLKISGTSLSPKILGKFNLSNLEMPYLNTTIKGLSLEFKPTVVKILTKGEVMSNYIMGTAELSSVLKQPYVVNDAYLYINSLDVNQLVTQLKQLELKGLSSAITTGKDEEIENYLDMFKVKSAKIRAGQIFVKNLTASNLEAICAFNNDNRKTISIDSFNFDMAEGIISGNLKYNLQTNLMNMGLSANRVNANVLTIALFDLPNQIFGDLTGHLEISCNATDDKTRFKTLEGHGQFNVSNGKMPKLGSLEYLLKAGNLLRGGITSITMNSIIDMVTPLKTGEFSNIHGRFRIENGIAKTVEIHSHGKNLNLYITGRYDFIESLANMRVYGQISRRASTVLGAAGNISLNTLFNKIPGVSKSQFISDLNKIPGIDLSNKSTRKFIVEILGDINGEDFVKSFKWIN